MTKVDETPVSSQLTVYLKTSVQNILGGIKPGDVLEWHVEDQRVVVKKT